MLAKCRDFRPTPWRVISLSISTLLIAQSEICRHVNVTVDREHIYQPQVAGFSFQRRLEHIARYE